MQPEGSLPELPPKLRVCKAIAPILPPISTSRESHAPKISLHCLEVAKKVMQAFHAECCRLCTRDHVIGNEGLVPFVIAQGPSEWPKK